MSWRHVALQELRQTMQSVQFVVKACKACAKYRCSLWPWARFQHRKIGTSIEEEDGWNGAIIGNHFCEIQISKADEMVELRAAVINFALRHGSGRRIDVRDVFGRDKHNEQHGDEPTEHVRTRAQDLYK